VPDEQNAVTVLVNVGVDSSNAFPFTVQPRINSIAPASAAAGSTLTLNGDNFGAAQGTARILFGGGAAGTITAWSPTRIMATVPAGGTNGVLTLQTTYGSAVSGTSFAYLPRITGLTPNNGPVNTLVTIAGDHFGAAQGANTVTFNGVLAAVTAWGDAQITARVPLTATSGPVVVNVNGQASNGVNFTVLTPPASRPP